MNSSAVEGDWGLVLKPYASCGSSHAAVDAVIEVVNRHQIPAARIEQIDVHVDPAVTAMLPHHDPQTSLEGRYSMEYTIAVAAVDRAGGADQFATASIGRSDVRSLMSRVVISSDLRTGDDDKFAAEVGVTFGGERFSARVDYAQGHPNNPMDDAARWSKFSQSVRPILGARAETLYSTFQRIEAVARWTEVAELVRP
jgi:2-methylcitrate dehydratase PrpD